MTNIHEIMTAAPVIPVLAFKSVREAVSVSSVLIEEGLKVLEITLRHPTALEAIKECAKEFGGDAYVGAGTVMNPDLLKATADAGAVFGVSPGLTDTLQQAILDSGMAFLPGTATVSEAMRAADAGFKALKFFPAEASGGVSYLKGVGAVLPDVQFCPTGGVTLEKAKAYRALPTVPVVGGSWLTPRGDDGEIDLNAVRQHARDAVAIG